MYDPFAPPQMHSQVMPNPQPLAPNNALAPAFQGGPTMTPGGGTTGAPLQGPNGQFPLNPSAALPAGFPAGFTLPPGVHLPNGFDFGAITAPQGPFDEQGYEQALQSWRTLQPEMTYEHPYERGRGRGHFPGGDWFARMQDWLGQRPSHSAYYGTATPATGA